MENIAKLEAFNNNELLVNNTAEAAPLDNKAAAAAVTVTGTTTVASGVVMAPSSKAANSKTMPVAPKYKKAPDAPKRFKSAFIIYSAEKHKIIKEDLAKVGRAEKTTDIAKLVSEAWREMGPEEKESWEKKARKDKARYEVEKAMYKGPWKVPANKRTPKDPTAPKRPMSAFLAFSNKRRAGLKREHPDATNADLSKMLSKTWREAPDELRKKYMEEEAELRAHYKVEMAKWRKKVADEKKHERTEREAIAMQTAEARANEPPPVANMAGLGNQYGGGGVGPQGQMQQQQQAHELAGGGGGGAGQMYGNPYGMAGAAGSQLGGGGLGGFGAGNAADAAQYANLMAGGNPFAAQSLMGMGAANAASAQQQLLNQLFGQQFKHAHPMAQGNPLGMYSGLAGQGLGGGQGNQGQGGGQGGFGSNAAAAAAYGGAFGMGGGGGMDNMAAQRAMLEAAQAGQMQQQMQNQGGGHFNQGGFPGAGGGGAGAGGGPSDWLGQNFGRPDQEKKEDEQLYRGQM